MLFSYADDYTYNDNLPDHWDDDVTIRAISVSSIVAGSDVEVDPQIVTDPSEFWDTVEAVTEEASFYWERDNSVWLKLIPHSGETIYISQSAGTHEYWASNNDVSLAQAAVEAYFDNRETLDYQGTEYRLTEDPPDYTF
jgi:hypothetical protein